MNRVDERISRTTDLYIHDAIGMKVDGHARVAVQAMVRPVDVQVFGFDEVWWLE